jgi:predicted ATPase/DNA-binding XRE family transcriptional regulator
MHSELTFGQWLKRRRRGLGLTQRSLAQQAGYSSETIRKVEAGDSRPSRQMAERLAAALQINAADRARFVSFARAETEDTHYTLPTQTVHVQSDPQTTTETRVPPGAGPRRHNLPAALTTFIGREREILDIRQLLSTRRLVTLTGTGGMGKSRLAIEVARGMLEDFPRGAWMVEFASLAEPSLVPQVVAHTLGVIPAPGEVFEAALASFVQEKSLLLLLDNCEHLIGACAQLAQALLGAGAKLHILATSRQDLDIAGEVNYSVPPLSLPQARQALPAEQVLQSEAVRLFLDRAALVLPAINLTAADLPVVVQVCQRLEGMPLALELAAARVKVLGLEQIAARLSDQFGLLTGGSRSALPQHQTLRATIEWSFKLLSESEKAVMRRCSVFAGGWTMEAAETVCCGIDVEVVEILDILTNLARKSIIWVERAPQRDARYRLLETMRQYAQEKLCESGDEDTARRSHLHFYLQMAEAAEQRVYRADQSVWWGRLNIEIDNMRAALEWSLAPGRRALLGLRMAGALYRFWVHQRHNAEGVAWLDKALATQGQLKGDEPAEYCRTMGVAYSRAAWVIMSAGEAERGADLADAGLALCHQFGSKEELAFAALIRAWTTAAQGELDQATSLFDIAAELAEAAGHRWYVAVTQYQLAGIALKRLDFDRAARLWEKALVLCRESGDHLGVAQCLQQLGRIARLQGLLDKSRMLFLDSLSRYRELGLDTSVASALDNLGHLALDMGNLAEAEHWLEESHGWYREMGLRVRHDMGWNLYLQGNLAHRRTDFPKAIALLNESLAIAAAVHDWPFKRSIQRTLGAVARAQGHQERAITLVRENLESLRQFPGNRLDYADTLRDTAIVSAALKHLERAARLFAAADAFRLGVGSPLAPVDQVETDRAINLIVTVMGEIDFAKAWKDGQTLTLEQAITLALAD